MPNEFQKVIVMNSVVPIGAADKAAAVPVKASEPIPVQGPIQVAAAKWVYEVAMEAVPAFSGNPSIDQQANATLNELVKRLNDRFNQGWEIHQTFPIVGPGSGSARQMFVFRRPA